MDTEYLYSLVEQSVQWIRENIFVEATLIELVVMVVLLMVAKVLLDRIRPQVCVWLEQLKGLEQEDLVIRLRELLYPIVVSLLLWGYVILALGLNFPFQIIRMVGNLLSAWIGVSVAFTFFEHQVLARLFGFMIWGIAALNILNIYERTVHILNKWNLELGELNISILTVIKGGFFFTILFWLAEKIIQFVDERIREVPDLNPSSRVLVIKIINFLVFAVAGLVALNSIGIKLTTLTVFGGAVGLGLGFGLQKVVSNYISGIIILLDKSVKPGDVIEIGGVYGWVTSLNLRFVSVVTREGKEFLIPNEEFITQKVINWSYTNNLVRVKTGVGVSYNCDLELAMQLVLQAADEVERIKRTPTPICLLTGFGDSSVNLELRFWISDPENGIDNVKSQVFLAIWQLFKENEIEIPFPQQDLHIRSIDNQRGGEDQTEVARGFNSAE